MKQKWYKYLVYVSIIFLLIALYQANYLQIPKIYVYSAFVTSILFLCLGALGQGVVWYATLQKSNYPASFATCLAGVGLSIFTKYIPGKVFIIVGRAAYVAEKLNYPVSKLSIISLHAQFIAFWVALSIGSLGPLCLAGFGQWRWMIILGWIALSLVVFSKHFHQLIEKWAAKLFNKNIQIPWLDFQTVIRILPAYLVPWTCWSIAFYFLVISLSTIGFVPLAIGFGMPLATVLGMIAIIAPGGIGIREGVLVAFLVLAGFPTTEATTISVASRLWFLLGEFFIFGVAYLMDVLIVEKY